MKKPTLKLAVLLAAAVSAAAFAEGTVPNGAGPKSVHEIIHRESGGRLRTLYPRTKGVYYVNAQKRVGANVVEEARARIGCLVLGGISSVYRENLLGFVGSPEGLDKFTDDTLPVDGPLHCGRYLLSLGVKPYRDVTYKKACQEGWAPQPTNDVQKAIWEQVKADKERGPTNPITIPPPNQKK